jgi:hypothetical protein
MVGLKAIVCVPHCPDLVEINVGARETLPVDQGGREPSGRPFFPCVRFHWPKREHLVASFRGSGKMMMKWGGGEVTGR